MLIDGFHHPGLHNVAVARFTVKDALYEGILAVSTADITIHGNDLIDNDAIGPVFNPSAANCLGQPAYETDETGDCGGAVHLIGVSYSTVSGNLMTGNVDGVLISDETAISQGNLITQNSVVNYPLECDIVLASSPRRVLRPHYAPNMGSSTIRSPITSPPATASKLAVPA